MSYYAPYQAPEPPPPPPKRAWGRELLSALVVAVAVFVGGALLGLAWYLLAPPLPLRKVEGGLAYTSPQPEQLAAQDGWFAILGFAFGILAAVGAWVLARRYRGPIQLFAVLVGAVGAGWLAWQIGMQIDQDEYRQAVASAPMGTVIAYAVLAGWSRWPSLRREEDEQERLVQGGGWPELGEVRRDGPYFPQQ